MTNNERSKFNNELCQLFLKYGICIEVVEPRVYTKKAYNEAKDRFGWRESFHDHCMDTAKTMTETILEGYS